MPRLRQPPVALSAVVLIAVACPSTVRSAAIAAAAGTLFEALPFVLACALLPRGRLVRAFDFLGCGCGTTAPGALALPAIGLCLVAFGPLVTTARALAAIVIAIAPRLRAAYTPLVANACENRATPPSDPLGQIARLAPQALAGALLAEGLRAAPIAAWPAPVTALVMVAGGLLLGVLLPCTTGAVAIAAGLRGVAPAATVALLLTAGIVRLRGPAGPRGEEPREVDRSGVSGASGRGAERWGFVLLAIASADIACRGPSGFVNPRFVVPLGLVAVAAVVLARYVPMRTTVRFPAAVPAFLILATIAGSPLPHREIDATTLDDPYVGESVRFVGSLAPRGGRAAAGSTLVRYTITCCRADAEAHAVRLNRPLAGAPGTWYDARGVLELEPDGAFALKVRGAERIPAPADPFAYR